MTHLQALLNRLANENARLTSAKGDSEINYRAMVIAGIAKEIKAEYEFIGGPLDSEASQLSDDDLLRELVA